MQTSPPTLGNSYELIFCELFFRDFNTVTKQVTSGLTQMEINIA